MFTWVDICVCAPQRPKEVIATPGARVVGDTELSDKGGETELRTSGRAARALNC